MRDIKFRAWGKGAMWGSYAALRILRKDDNDFIVMQFTGLKDKNGVEIYEGDIIKAWDHHQPEILSFEILSQMFGFFKHKDRTNQIGTFECLGDYHSDEGIEVVGNIYENPELCDVNVATSEGGSE